LFDFSAVFLAHNKITGTIPNSIQERPFLQLDLSYNKLTGTYDNWNGLSDEDSSLVLEVNRLSGRFPSFSSTNSSGSSSATSIFGELNALRGNLFSCHYIPDEDVYSEDFSCGSENLEFSLYSFVVSLAFTALCVTILFVVVREEIIQSPFASNLVHLFNNRQLYISHLETLAKDSSLFEKVRRICFFSQELGVVSKIFLVLLCVNAITCLPIYGVKFSEYGANDIDYSTHKFQYQWVMSIAYIRGNVPAVLVMFMWTCVISVVVLFVVKDGPLHRFVTTSHTHSRGKISISNKEASDTATPSTLQSSLTYSSIFLFNIIVTGSVNGLYIYYSEQALTPAVHLSIQIAVAVFKVGWNMAIVSVLARPLKTPGKIVEIELVILVFNNIVIPSIVTGFTSPACFQVRDTQRHVVRVTFGDMPDFVHDP
jgi:hypothetical protein